MRKITGWLAAFGLAAALASGTAVQVYAAPAETEETAAVSAEETADSAETAEETVTAEETAEAPAPESKDSYTIFRYPQTSISAAVAYPGKNYKTVVFGFPIETLKTQDQIDKLIGQTINFFIK